MFRNVDLQYPPGEHEQAVFEDIVDLYLRYMYGYLTGGIMTRCEHLRVAIIRFHVAPFSAASSQLPRQHFFTNA